MTTPMGNYRDPSRREHFVYRAWDADDRLLYIGCTMRLAQRQADHRMSSDWYARAVRFKIAGPFNYDTARRLEKQGIRSEMPLWNCDEPHRVRIRALHKRISERWHRFNRSRQAEGDSWLAAWRPAADHADHLIPLGRHRAGVMVTDEDVARAAAAEAADLKTFNAMVRREGRRSA